MCVECVIGGTVPGLIWRSEKGGLTSLPITLAACHSAPLNEAQTLAWLTQTF